MFCCDRLRPRRTAPGGLPTPDGSHPERRPSAPCRPRPPLEAARTPEQIFQPPLDLDPVIPGNHRIGDTGDAGFKGGPQARPDAPAYRERGRPSPYPRSCRPAAEPPPEFRASAAGPAARTRLSGSSPGGSSAKRKEKPGLSSGSARSAARSAARSPAASPSKQSTGSGASRHSSCELHLGQGRAERRHRMGEPGLGQARSRPYSLRPPSARRRSPAAVRAWAKP